MSRLSAPQEARMVSFLGFHWICARGLVGGGFWEGGGQVGAHACNVSCVQAPPQQRRRGAAAASAAAAPACVAQAARQAPRQRGC
jgi:hypothetical protein